MTKLISNQKLQQYRSSIDDVIANLQELCNEVTNEELSRMVSDLRKTVHEPFLFVIVGEVKAGKSSFINALLETGTEICKVAPQPMTDTIQQILYGETEEIIEVNPHYKKIYLPIEILKEIAIVDTPGTNTIAAHHQEITERFIPSTDLIVFVFEAKNPYRQSAWDFFDYIHKDWHKKIIFVLQQKDLLPQEALDVNMQGVIDHAEKKGIQNPNVFAVSALDELNGKLETSGFVSVRNYIKENITGGKAPILKLRNNLTNSNNILKRIENGVNIREKQYLSDMEFRKKVRETLDLHQETSNSKVRLLVENLIATYDNSTLKIEKELTEGLQFFKILRKSVNSIFNKKSSSKEWLVKLASDLESDLNAKMEAKLHEGVVDLASSIQQMGREVDYMIKNSDTILKDDDDFFPLIAEKRNSVLEDLRGTFKRFLKDTENFTAQQVLGDGKLAPNVATGSGIALIGAILTAFTQVSVLDITGGILTAVGLMFAGFSVGFQRRKIIKSYNKEIGIGREKIRKELTEHLLAYVENIKVKIDLNFSKFDSLLESEKDKVSYIKRKCDIIGETIVSLKEIEEFKHIL